MNVHVTTNHVPRELVYGFQLTPEERREFDYIEDIDTHAFVRYRGEVYDPAEFMPVPGGTCAPDGIEQLETWDGYQPDSYFSGLVLRYSEDCEQVVVGTYYATSDCS